MYYVLLLKIALVDVVNTAGAIRNLWAGYFLKWNI